MMSETSYVPGVCNIGKDEIKVRRNNAILMAVVSVIAGATLLLIDIDKAWRLVLVLPLAGFANGIQQWYFKFCVYFGMKGLFNFGMQGSTEAVELAEMRKQDQSKALRMIIVSILFGLTVSLGLFLLP